MQTRRHSGGQSPRVRRIHRFWVACTKRVGRGFSGASRQWEAPSGLDLSGCHLGILFAEKACPDPSFTVSTRERVLAACGAVRVMCVACARALPHKTHALPLATTGRQIPG